MDCSWIFVFSWIYVKHDKTLNQNLSEKYSQEPFDNAKQSLTDEFKSGSKREIQTMDDAKMVIWLVIKLQIKLHGVLQGLF